MERMLVDAPGYEAGKATDDKPGKKPGEVEKPLDADAIKEILKNIPQ